MNKFKKEATKTSKNIVIKDEVTEALLKEYCPKQHLVKFKAAKTQGQRADLLYALDKERLALQKEAATIGSFTAKLEKWFIQELPERDATGIAGNIARVQVVKKERPSVMDWEKLYAYIKKNSAFELLNRAVNNKSVKERWDNGKTVPGVERFSFKDISLTKVK